MKFTRRLSEQCIHAFAHLCNHFRACWQACFIVVFITLLTATSSTPADTRMIKPEPDNVLAKLPLDFCPVAVTYINPGVTLNPGSPGRKSSAYQSGLDSTTWSGTLKKFIIASDEDTVSVGNHVQWDAGVLLTDLPNYFQRIILTYNTDLKETVPFTFATLPVELQAEFNRDPATGLQDNLGKERVHYIYGDKSLEKDDATTQHRTFRKRAGLLGDIVHSVPVIEGGASEHAQGAEYDSFYAQYRNRADTLFVGANDGMLHAFSADTGNELFAYIPSPLQRKLPQLSDPNYQHDSFVDGLISVSEAQINGVWKTVLATGMGTGAEGLFVLDVTNPQAFMAGSRTLLEFTESDDSDIGYVTRTPLIVKLNVSGNNGKNSPHALQTAADYAYFVLVPNGASTSHPHGDSYLFLLSLDKNSNSAWVLNKNYYKIKTGDANSVVANSLSTPGAVVDSHGAVTNAYAGDLSGNIWRFNFAAATSLSTLAPVRLFTAKDANDRAQPITAQPAITYAPERGALILFGTGKYENETDIHPSDAHPNHFNSNSFYAIYSPDSSDEAELLIHARSELAQRKLNFASASDSRAHSGYQIMGTDFVYGDGKTEDEKKGWYMDFPQSEITGERSISKALISNGHVYFNTIIPSTSPCKIKTTSRSYQLDTLTGKSKNMDKITGFTTHSGILGSPVSLLTRSESSARDAMGGRTTTQLYAVFNFNGGNDYGTISPVETDKVEQKTGRLSWREIQNWQDLK